MRRELDLILVVACALALTIVILAFPFAQPARVALGLPFVLFFPGYASIAALFPRKGDLDSIERIALSLGLSIAIVPLIGLALNYSPWGIRLNPVLAFVTLFIVLTATAGLIRRRMLPVDEAFSLTIDIQLPRWSQVRLADRLLAVGLVVTVVALGIGAFFIATSRRSSERFTEFYVLGPGGMAESYPRQLKVGEEATVILGIANHEGQAAALRVVIRIDGETTRSIDGLLLADGDRWEQRVALPPTSAGDDQKVEFLLYKDGESEAYRSLHLWLTVQPVLVETFPSPTPGSQAEPIALSEAAPSPDEAARPAEPTPAATEAPPTLHIVVAGENLTRIAGNYGLSLGALLAVNDIENPNLIYPDQRINLPPSGGGRESQ